MKKFKIAISLVVLFLLFWISSILYHKQKISTLTSLIQTGDVAGVSQIIAAHPELLQADLDQERMSQLKPLSLAAGLGQEAMCSNLLALGENVNEQDRFHYTPLHHTILPDQTNTAALLLRQGADLTIKDFEGLTPFDYAKKYNASSNMMAVLSNAISHRISQ